jgi:hypothetical protein
MMMRTTMSRYDEQFEERMNPPRKQSSNYYNKESKGRKKITVVLYKNEIHLMGAPKDFEVVVLNLDKGMLIENDDDFYDE